jgi:hypothetical protein
MAIMDGTNTVVISAANSFMTSSQQLVRDTPCKMECGNSSDNSSGGPGVLAYGLIGSISHVPPGFSLEVMMSLGAGPNQAVRKWGGLLTHRYNKTNPEDKDFTTTHLGYDTDNGAFYYYNPEPNKTPVTFCHPRWRVRGNQAIFSCSVPKVFDTS